MTEQECLERMVAPGTRRPGKYREGVIQIHVTRACDKACFGCTQGSNFAGRTEFMSVEHFRQAVESLRGYFGVVGVFGGNPAVHPQFQELCAALRKSWVPFEQRGLWCNNPMSEESAQAMRFTFDPAVSNLNVHLDAKAYELFKRGWPECNPVGLERDSRHSPPFVSMKDVGVPETERWELISRCDINQHWSAMVGVFRGQLRAWFCEVAGAQAMLHQGEEGYPDTGLEIVRRGKIAEWLIDGRGNPVPVMPMPGTCAPWWQLPMQAFANQVRKHCHECGVPLRGHGELAQAAEGAEQLSASHSFRPKRKRDVETVTDRVQLGMPLNNVVRYLQNAGK